MLKLVSLHFSKSKDDPRIKEIFSWIFFARKRVSNSRCFKNLAESVVKIVVNLQLLTPIPAVRVTPSLDTLEPPKKASKPRSHAKPQL